MLSTVQTVLRHLFIAAVTLAAGCGIVVVSTSPALAAPSKSYVSSTVLIDISFVASNAKWEDKMGNPQKGSLYGNVQASGFYASEGGKVISTSTVFDPKGWRAKQTIIDDWSDIWLEDVDSAIRPLMLDALKLGTIKIDSITITDSKHLAGVDANYKVTDGDEDGYVLLKPNKTLDVSPLAIADAEPKLGAKYYAYFGEYKDNGDKVTARPVTVSDEVQNGTGAKYFVKQSVTSVTAMNGGVVGNEDVTKVIGLLGEDPDDAGTVYLLSNSMLRDFMQANGLLDDVTPSGSTTDEPSSEPTQSEPTPEPSESVYTMAPAEPTYTTEPAEPQPTYDGTSGNAEPTYTDGGPNRLVQFFENLPRGALKFVIGVLVILSFLALGLLFSLANWITKKVTGTSITERWHKRLSDDEVTTDAAIDALDGTPTEEWHWDESSTDESTKAAVDETPTEVLSEDQPDGQIGSDDEPAPKA